MAAPSPPTGYSAAELDAIFADMFNKAYADSWAALNAQTPPELQGFLNYYLGVPPAAGIRPLYANSIATGVIKDTPGKLWKVLVVDPGTAGAFTMNNCATVGAATGGNQIISYTGLWPGQIIDVNFVCDTGIVVSAMRTGGQFTIVYT